MEIIEVYDIVNGCSADLLAEFSDLDYCKIFCIALTQLGFDILAI